LANHRQIDHWVLQVSLRELLIVVLIRLSS
jgi:hypothetical protein